MDVQQPEQPKPMDTNQPQAHLLPQEDLSDLNEIINEINNPSLLSDTDPTPATTETSPSNSPAKKKSKPSSTVLPKQSTETTQSQKKKSKKRTSTTSPASVLKPSRYAQGSGKSKKAPPTPPHAHTHCNVLLDISIDFSKESLSQFEGDNRKMLVFAIQQLLINLKIADKMATMNPTEASTDEPSLGGQTSHPVPTNLTALSNYIKGLNPRAFQTNGRAAQVSQDLAQGSAHRNSAIA
jgi:cytoskeletal protein RodZ